MKGLGFFWDFRLTCEAGNLPEAVNFAPPTLWADGNALWFSGWLGQRKELLAAFSRCESYAPQQLAAEAWKKWRQESLQRLEGEFVLVHWNFALQELTLAHSRTAAYNLFYFRSRDGFALSTRLEDLKSRGGLSHGLDTKGFQMWASGHAWLRHDPERTCFTGIRRLPHAYLLKVRPTGETSQNYWTPKPREVVERPEDAIAKVRDLIAQSVQDACYGAENVGCLLSGGLDSSAIAGFASIHSRLTPICSVLSPQYSNTELTDEKQWAQIVAARMNSPVQWVHPAQSPGPWTFPRDFFEWSPSPRLSPRHDLYRALLLRANECGCEIILDGSGGEIGPSARQEGLILQLLLRGKWTRALQEIAAHSRQIGWLRTLRRLIFSSVWNSLAAPPAPVPQAFLSPHYRLSGELAVRPWRGRSSIIGLRTSGTKAFQSTGLNRTGVIFRRPLLSPSLVEYCSGLAVELTSRNGLDRSVLREACRDVIPEQVYRRTDKKAFSPDFQRRCQDSIQVAAQTWNELNKNSSVQELLDGRKVSAILRWAKDEPGLLKSPLLERVQATLAAAQFLVWRETL